MAYYKFTVVGGVAIPNYAKAIAALTGINGCLFYRYSHGMDSKYGVKLPKQLTRFVAGTSAILAGHTAYDLYEFNKLLERMDRVEFEKMRAGKHQKFRAFSMLLLTGAMSLATVTGYMVYKFHMDFEKKRAMEEKENSANPYSVCDW